MGIESVLRVGGKALTQVVKKAYIKPECTVTPFHDLYHITTRANYLKMQCDKTLASILPSLDGCFGKQSVLKGIFTTTKENLHNWQYSNSWTGHLGLSLLKHAAKKKDNLVCLKIPISSLDKNKIIIRSQNNLFSFINRGAGNANEAYHGIPLIQINQLKKTDAIEYIYTGGAIPLESIEVVGRANAKDIAKRLPQNATETMWFKETMKDLFGNKF